MTDAAGARDPGLQPERTVLAWRRTALTTCGVVVAVLKLHTGEHHRLLGVAIAALLGVTAATMAGLWLRRNRYRTDSGHRHPAPTLIAGCICLGISLAALCCAMDLVV